MIFHKLPIAKTQNPTTDSVELSFDIPDSLKSDFKYLPGQYITLRTTIDGEEVRRAYSMSSIPEDSFTTVVVKKVHDGRFSSHAMELQKGQTLEVAPPEGIFTHTPVKESANYLLVAAGSGITPVMSILRSILTDEPTAQVALIYGNKSVNDTIYHDRIKKLQQTHEERFVFLPCYSRTEEPEAPFGRVDRGNLNYLLRQWSEETGVALDGDAFAKAYLCGPKPMIDSVQETLLEKGLLKKEHIAFELFENDDAEIEVTEDSSLTEVTVILDDEEHSFTMRRDEVLLDAILEEGLNAPYSCQGGICSSCVAQLDGGKATMRKNSILTDDEIEDGLTLTCQAQPTTAKVTVNFDEV